MAYHKEANDNNANANANPNAQQGANFVPPPSPEGYEPNNNGVDTDPHGQPHNFGQRVDAAFGADEWSVKGVNTDVSTVSSIAEFLSGPLETRGGNERSMKIIEAFKKHISDMNVNADIDFIEFDGARHGLVYPAIICTIAIKDVQNNTNGIAYGVMIVQDQTQLNPRQEVWRNETIELPVAAVDLYNDFYNGKVITEIKRRKPELGDVEFKFSGISVLYPQADLNSQASVMRVIQELSKQASTKVLEESIYETDTTTSLGKFIREHQLQLLARLDFNPAQQIEVDGNPTAVDLMISTTARSNNQQQQYNGLQVDNQHLTQDHVVDVGVVLDLIHVDQPQQTNPYNPYASLNQPKTFPYVGNLVITHISHPSAMVTLSTIMVAVSTALIATNTEIFPELLKPRRNSGTKISLGDIGDIGYQIPDEKGVYDHIDVHSAAFTAQGNAALYDMVFENIDPNLIVSIDIPDSILGRRSIVHLREVARGNVPSINRLASTLSSLTEGIFEQTFDWSTTPVMGNTPILVPLGYFVDPNGNRRDLREINFLAALHHHGTSGNEFFIEDWQATYLMPDAARACAIRLAKMKEIVGHDNVYVTGYAWRYTFTRAFLSSLMTAMVNSRLAPTFNNLVQNDRNRFTNNIANYQDYQMSNQQANWWLQNTRRGYNGDNRASNLRGNISPYL